MRESATELTSSDVIKMGARIMRKLEIHEMVGQTCSWVFDIDGELVDAENESGKVWRPAMCGKPATHVSRPGSRFALFYCANHMKMLKEKKDG